MPAGTERDYGAPRALGKRPCHPTVPWLRTLGRSPSGCWLDYRFRQRLAKTGGGPNAASPGRPTQKWRNSPFLVNSHELERRNTQGFGLWRLCIRARLEPCRRIGRKVWASAPADSGKPQCLKPLATDTLRHGSSRALMRSPPPGFHFHVAHLHRPGASQTGLHLGYTDARGRGAAFAVPACPSAFGDGGQDVRHTGCQT